jgi:hypothetical protein
MCNLYSITTNQAAIIALFRVINRYVGNLPPMPGVFPDYPAPALVLARKRLGLSRQLPILILLAMRGDGLRHFFLLRNKPTFCFCASVSRLLARLLN